MILSTPRYDASGSIAQVQIKRGRKNREVRVASRWSGSMAAEVFANIRSVNVVYVARHSPPPRSETTALDCYIDHKVDRTSPRAPQVPHEAYKTITSRVISHNGLETGGSAEPAGFNDI
ncbi:jg10754 [Pararge aegeria aegeria]|uniref:Jg10754 protein n=1 Tax=Pararge aegeria aegeria TaxID=348720 RepID=A0A8S4RFQ2_9NEOP|nr:jg10754 [Pararge aegeria aegeria]